MSERIGRQVKAAAKNELAFVLFTEVFGRNTVEFETGDGDFPEATGLDGMIFNGFSMLWTGKSIWGCMLPRWFIEVTAGNIVERHVAVQTRQRYDKVGE